MIFSRTLILAGVSSLLSCALAQAAPYINPTEDFQHFGEPEKILFWTPEQKVAGFRNGNLIYPTRKIAAGNTALPLPQKILDMSSIAIPADNGQISLDDYIQQRDVAGLLVIKDGQILFERYALGNDQNTLWLSWSVAKSLTSLLVGAALKDGYIESVNEQVSDYLPRLKGTAYEQVTLKNLLQMSSGVSWDEDYADPQSDINLIEWPTLSTFDYLKNKKLAARPGSLFNYSTAEANLVGDLLRSAIGNNLSTYASEKIWKPFGMESDAYWELTEPGGGEYGGSSFYATLRDYGRIGLFAMANGKLPDGTQILPDYWMRDSTQGSQDRPDYGYLWWLYGDGRYHARGIFGQSIYIDPQAKLVIALHSAWPQANTQDYMNTRTRMFEAISAATENQASR